MRFFRPPFFGDAEPSTPNEVEPLLVAQKLGYLNVGLRIDPDDWQKPDPNLIVQRTDIPPGMMESKKVAAGDDLPVFETDAGKIGVFVCSDLRFPEIAPRADPASVPGAIIKALAQPEQSP